LLAALFFSLDGLELVDSRTGLIDIFAVFFVVLGLWLFTLHWRARTRGQWLWTLYLTALVSGLGVAAKADMVPAVILMAVLLAARWVRPHLRMRGLGGAQSGWLLPPSPDDPLEAGRRTMVSEMRWGWHYLAGAAVMVVVFYLSFFNYWTISHSIYVNFADTSGPSAACTEFTTSASTCQLPVAMPIKDDHFGPVSIWLPTGFNVQQSLVDMEMNSLAGLSYQATLKATHPFSSPYYTWPLDAHPVLYYAVYTGNGVTTTDGQTVSNYEWISDMGNPAIFWLGMLALAACLYRTLRRRDRVALFILLGFLFNWLLLWSWPSRILFFYEILEAVPFTCLALAYCCTRLAFARGALQLGPVRLGPYSLRPLAGAVVLAVILSFAYFYPLWTGQPIPSNEFFQHIWLPGWY
jgi:dolichyl-phosphate-mannose--protein O-mannosyl transferase